MKPFIPESVSPEDAKRFRLESFDSALDLMAQYADRVANNLEQANDKMSSWETLRMFAQVLRDHKIDKTKQTVFITPELH